MSTDLHLISFDVPYPPIYGGIIDVFHKLRWLHKEGLRVHLHCFTYRSSPAPELQEFCEKVSYYPRGSMVKALFSGEPMIIQSRNHPTLVQRILEEKAPVLCEGVHTLGLAHLFREAGIPVFLRAHNLEHQYYRGLSQYGGWKAIYYREEARRLAIFEKKALSVSGIIPISTTDAAWFSEHHPHVPFTWCPPFHSIDQPISSSPSEPSYALFHGNLAIPENHAAAVFLLQEVFPSLSMPLVIAGANPSSALMEMAATYPHVQLKSNLSFEEMEKWIREASVVVLPAMQSSGVKLKLIHSLMHQKVVVANRDMMTGTGLEDCVFLVHSPMEWKACLQQKLWEKRKDNLKAEKALLPYFNQNNIKNLIQFIYSHT